MRERERERERESCAPPLPPQYEDMPLEDIEAEVKGYTSLSIDRLNKEAIRLKVLAPYRVRCNEALYHIPSVQEGNAKASSHTLHALLLGHCSQLETEAS